MTLPSCSAFSLKSGLDLSTAVGRTEIARACCACVKLAIVLLCRGRGGVEIRTEPSHVERRKLRNSIVDGTRPHDAMAITGNKQQQAARETKVQWAIWEDRAHAGKKE